MIKLTRDDINDLILDSIWDLFYHDTKNNDEREKGDIKHAIETGVITKEELLKIFEEQVSLALERD